MELSLLQLIIPTLLPNVEHSVVKQGQLHGIPT